MSKFWVACLGDEVDMPMGIRDTQEEAIVLCEQCFEEAIPADTPFFFIAYDAETGETLMATEDVEPVAV